MPLTAGPLILLSPAKTLDFAGKMSAALSAAAPTQPRMLDQSTTLSAALKKLGKAELKTLMSLSPALAELNHERYQTFETQPTRMAIGAFEGQAYKGLDARSLSSEQLAYCQSHLRILCGLYGVLRPFDESACAKCAPCANVRPDAARSPSLSLSRPCCAQSGRTAWKCRRG